MDLSKLKVPDLKKELKNRGLNTTGNKSELMERLQAALNSTESTISETADDLEEDLLNEDDDEHLEETTESVISDLDTALNDTLPSKWNNKRKLSETESTNGESKDGESKTSEGTAKKVVLNRNTPVIAEAKVSTESKASTESKVSTDSKESSDKASKNGTEEKKVIKLSTISAKERLEMRATKFGVPLSTEARKIARAERFGTVGNNTSSVTSTGINTKVDTSLDVLKQRAERFGGSVSKALSSLEVQEKLEKRKARFGLVSTSDKAKQRLERFKQPVK